MSASTTIRVPLQERLDVLDAAEKELNTISRRLRLAGFAEEATDAADLALRVQMESDALWHNPKEGPNGYPEGLDVPGDEAGNRVR